MSSLFLILLWIPYSNPQIQVISERSKIKDGRYFIQIRGEDFYLAVNNPVNQDSYQRAFFGPKDYIQKDATRYSKEVWLKETSDKSGFFIISKFGQVDSYLHVNGLVQTSNYQKAYFSSKSYLQGKSNYQHSFWFNQLGNNKFNINVGQGNIYSNFGSQQISTSSYGWAYFFGLKYSSTKFLELQLTRLEDNNVEECRDSDALEGNSATFYMTSDPQFRFGYDNNGGRTDGEKNAKQTYNFLGSQVSKSGCPQSFIGVSGDLNHEGSDWQQDFLNDFTKKYNNKQIIADILGNHDLKRLPKHSMVEKNEQEVNDIFLWNQAVKVRYVQRMTTSFQNYSHTAYHTEPAKFYTLELRNKKNPANLVAYVIMTHNQLEKNLCYLYQVSNQPDFNKSVPIILVSHAIVNFTQSLKNWIDNNKVAVILGGHWRCNHAYSQDHSDRRSNQSCYNYSYNIAQPKKVKIHQINTSGVRDRVFWSISINSTKVRLTRKVWTNNQRLPGFQVENKEIILDI